MADDDTEQQRKPPQWLALRDMIGALQQELEKANEALEGKATGPFLQVANLEIDLPVVLHMEAAANEAGGAAVLARTNSVVSPEKSDTPAEAEARLQSAAGGQPSGGAAAAPEATAPAASQVARIKLSFKKSLPSFKG